MAGGSWHLWRALQNYLAAAPGPSATDATALSMAWPVAVWALLNTLGWLASLAIIVVVMAERTQRRRTRKT